LWEDNDELGYEVASGGNAVIEQPGNPYWRGRLSTVDLLVLTSLNNMVLIMKILFTFVTKQAILERRSTVLSLPLQLGFPGEATHDPKIEAGNP
jgi:hypothetical protein